MCAALVAAGLRKNAHAMAAAGVGLCAVLATVSALMMQPHLALQPSFPGIMSAAYEMVPVLAALALLFANGYGLLAISPHSGRAPRAAFVAAFIVGVTFVPSANAMHVAPRTRVVLRMQARSGAKAAAEEAHVPTTSTPHATLSLRGGGDDVIHSHKFELRAGTYFMSTTTKQSDGSVKAAFSVHGDEVEALTLHWGVAINSDDEWITPHKGNCEDIIPHNSILYKDRAIRSKLKKVDGKLQLEITVPKDSKVLGIRFVLWEHDQDTWYPGGAGGNFYAPVKKGTGKKRLSLQRSPSWTGALDRDKMTVDSTPRKPQESHHHRDGRVEGELQQDLAHLMYNAAQRAKAWVDGRHETKAMRIQRSPSFENAIRIMEQMAHEKEKAEKEADEFFKTKGGRIYTKPFNYGNSKGNHRGMVKLTVEKSVATVTVIPALGDSGPGPITIHWGIGFDKVTDWNRPSSSILNKVPNTEYTDSSADTELTPVSGSKSQSVKIDFDGDVPKGITFVMKSGEAWYKTEDHQNFNFPIREDAREEWSKAQKRGPAAGRGGGGLVRTLSGTMLEAPAGSDVARTIMDFESKASTTLMHRYHQACDLLDKAPPGAPGRDTVNMIFCWLRYSQIRQLSWQRHYNTKPRELSAASERLNKMIAWRWKNAAPEDKEVFRLMLGTVGRGGSGGDGQAIRDEILHIMHRHHLPESKGTFMEEWHQKLHNNSTPDDIIICQAYLAFLHSNGNLDEFWRVIHENGITRDTLRKYERAIITDPQFYPDKKGGLINDFNNYLRILKNVHAGADLEKCVEVCRNFLEGHVVVLLQNILNQRGASDGRALAVIDSITEVRQLLGSRLIKEGDITKLRDLLYLDLGLEAQMRLMAERAVSAMDKVEIKTRTRALALWVSFALENLVYNSAPGVGAIQCQRETRDADELKAVLRDWAQLVEGAHKGYGGDWPTQAMSVVERMRRAMGHVVDVMQNNMQAKAEYLGYGLCSVTPEKIPEKWSITLFSEELVRGGGCSFVLSSFLRKLDKSIRAEGGGTLWQIISQGDPGAKGWLVQVPDLMSVQAETYDQPTILLAHSLSGEEEVPPGVVGVITPDAPDVLAHISVRARNLKVLFATCFDSDEFDGLARFVKKKVECKIQGNRVTVQEMSGDLSGKADMDGAAKKVSQIKIDLPPPTKFSKYALAESAVDPDAKPKIHGAKTANIVLSRRTLPEWIQTPRSAVIPFGVFEKVMSHPDNKHIAAEYKRLSEKELHASASPLKVLEDLKGLIKQLNAPIEMVNTVKQALVDSEIIEQGQLDGAEWDAAFMALKGVWASKWNDRAYYSCKKAGIGVEFVQMAVLVQRLVEAEYAFVIHTVNPSSNDSSYMYAEVVVGLGETLVGNFPGRALGFQMKKDGSSPPEIQSLPSKSTGLFGGGLIFRSDSNGEDLPGFAGAGLYDSIPMVTNTEQTILYHNEKLTTDKVFADDLMRGICKVAVDVEHAYGGAPQDIEGCYKDGKFYVVQTRPQV